MKWSAIEWKHAVNGAGAITAALQTASVRTGIEADIQIYDSGPVLSHGPAESCSIQFDRWLQSWNSIQLALLKLDCKSMTAWLAVMEQLTATPTHIILMNGDILNGDRRGSFFPAELQAHTSTTFLAAAVLLTTWWISPTMPFSVGWTIHPSQGQRSLCLYTAEQLQNLSYAIQLAQCPAVLQNVRMSLSEYNHSASEIFDAALHAITSCGAGVTRTDLVAPDMSQVVLALQAEAAVTPAVLQYLFRFPELRVTLWSHSELSQETWEALRAWPPDVWHVDAPGRVKL